MSTTAVRERLEAIFCAGCAERIGWVIDGPLDSVLYCDLCKKNEAWHSQEEDDNQEASR